MAFNFKAYLAQPTTILGISGFIATASGIVAHLLTHDTTATLAAAALAGSAVHVLMPDNSAAQSSIEKLVADTVTAAAQKRLASALPLLIADGLAAVQAMQPAAPNPAAPAPNVPVAS